MANQKNQDLYSDEEAERRFVAALRGARAAGHKTMKDISPKREKRAPAQLRKPSRSQKRLRGME
jgi:hypothetical protein